MKINKKQIAMLVLSLVVCVAVYLNWKFLQNSEYDNTLTTNGETSDIEPQAEDENTKTLGEAQYVSSAVTSVDEYFTNSRLSRRQSKDEAIELLKNVVSNESSSDEAVAKANAEISAIAEQTELESTIESLIKAKGFDDCVVFLSSDIANVVVHTEGLSAEQAAQINEIIVSHTKIPSSNIKIVEIK